MKKTEFNLTQGECEDIGEMDSEALFSKFKGNKETLEKWKQRINNLAYVINWSFLSRDLIIKSWMFHSDYEKLYPGRTEALEMLTIFTNPDTGETVSLVFETAPSHAKVELGVLIENRAKIVAENGVRTGGMHQLLRAIEFFYPTEIPPFIPYAMRDYFKPDSCNSVVEAIGILVKIGYLQPEELTNLNIVNAVITELIFQIRRAKPFHFSLTVFQQRQLAEYLLSLQQQESATPS